MIRIMEEKRREKAIIGEKAKKLGHISMTINPTAHFLDSYNEQPCREDLLFRQNLHLLNVSC